MTHILCCSGAIAKTSCSRVLVPTTTGNSGEAGSLAWDFDWSYNKTECGPGRYVAGVSRNTSTGLPHADLLLQPLTGAAGG